MSWASHSDQSEYSPRRAITVGHCAVCEFSHYTPEMPDYWRAWQPVGTNFFTVNLLQRHDNGLLIHHIEALRESIRWVKSRHPFVIHAWVILPEHLHCVMELPPDDANFAMRWRLTKMALSKSIPLKERRFKVR